MCFVRVLYLTLTLDLSHMEPIGIVSIGMNTACVVGCIVLLTIYSIDKYNEDISARWFYLLLTTIFFEVYSDAVSYIIDGYTSYLFENAIMVYISYLCTPLTTLFFWLYHNSLFKKNKPVGNAEILMYVVTIIDIIILTLNLKFNFIYYIDASNHYIINSTSWIASIIPTFMIVNTLITNIRTEMKLRERVTLLVFCLAPVIVDFLFIFFNNYSILGITEFALILAIYGNIQVSKNLEIIEMDKELIQKQTQMMVSQIQPHFIYNTLNTISGLCEEDPIKARDTVDNFAKYLRTNLEAIKKDQIIPFDQELQHTKTYLWIEQQRFLDRLNVEFDIQCSDFKIPSLTLQPIVENAVKHGVCKKKEGGTIKISSYKEGNNIYITVIDDGVGFDVNQKQEDRVHVGIENVSARLEYFSKGKLFIGSEIGKGTKATIVLAYQE